MKNPSVKSAEELVHTFQYDLGERIRLKKPMKPLAMPFGEVISNRQSSRQFNTITIDQLSEALWYTAKVKSLHQQENGYILTHRGSPSAGARHPIDVLVYNPTIFNNEHFYYYNPFDHSLNQIVGLNTTSLIEHINQIVPISKGSLLWFVAHQQRTAAKYENPESLIMRDSGALIASVQLTATAIGLNSCPIGSLGEPYVSDFFVTQKNVYGAGGLIVG